MRLSDPLWPFLNLLLIITVLVSGKAQSHFKTALVFFYFLKHRDTGRSRWELQHGSGGGIVHMSPAAVGSPRIKPSCSAAKSRPCFGVWQSSLCISARRSRNFHPHIMDHLICKPPAMWLEAERGTRAKSSLDVVHWSLSSHLGLQKLKICPSD